MTLEGKKVRLRPISLDDIDLALSWINDPEVTQTLMTGRYPMTREAERKWLEDHMKVSATDIIYTIEKLDGTYLGGITLFNIRPVEHHAEVGISIGIKSEWGKGYGREAMELMLRYGFAELNLHLIYLHVHADHPRAVRLYEKIGFVREGRLRDRAYRGGKYHDYFAMSILRDEWESLNTASSGA